MNCPFPEELDDPMNFFKDPRVAGRVEMLDYEPDNMRVYELGSNEPLYEANKRATVLIKIDGWSLKYRTLDGERWFLQEYTWETRINGT